MTPHHKENKDHKDIQILGGRLTLKQPCDGFRTALDSVMLAAACPIKEGQRLLDLGCGVGGAGLAVLARVSDTQMTGIDIQDDHIALAQENAALNSFDVQCQFQTYDICDYKPSPPFFDHVICNPPYLDSGAYMPSPSPSKATAHGHVSADITIQDWVSCAHRSLQPGGTLTLIHRADQLDKIIAVTHLKFGGIEIIPLYPDTKKPAKRVILRGLKDRKTPGTLYQGLVLHQSDGDYTPETQNILRHLYPLLTKES